MHRSGKLVKLVKSAINFAPVVQQNGRLAYKMYLKDLVLDNIPDVYFRRPPDQTKLEQVVSTNLKQHIILSACTANELKEDGSKSRLLRKAGKILCKDIATSSAWK